MDDRFLSYMFVPAHHETDRQMNGSEEYGQGDTIPYGKKLKMTRIPYALPDKLYYNEANLIANYARQYYAAISYLK